MKYAQSQADAVMRGLRFYEGRFCKRVSAHGRVRYAVTGHCVACHKAKAILSKASTASHRRLAEALDELYAHHDHWNGQ